MVVSIFFPIVLIQPHLYTSPRLYNLYIGTTRCIYGLYRIMEKKLETTRLGTREAPGDFEVAGCVYFYGFGAI